MKKKKITVSLLLMLSLMVGMILMASLLGGCGQSEKTGDFDVNADYQDLVNQAKGTTVTFYGWGGDEKRNAWLDDVVAPMLKEKYDITLKRVSMDIDQILTKMSGEKQAGDEKGSVDLIWINGENFYSAKENDLLFGPFASKLPNYNKYVDTDATENQYDFGYPIEGYEIPYGKAQLVLINDSALTSETPSDTEELLAYVKKYPGKVTYPALPDFTGSAFVRNVIYDVVGYEQFQDMKADKKTVKKAIEPALKYLRSLNPYLWNQGKSFPASSTEVDNMYADGQLYLTMSYDPYSVTNNIADKVFSKTSRTFIFDSGMIGNTNYIAMSALAPNKAGAMVVMNELLSPEVQISQFSELKTLPVLDDAKLSTSEKEALSQVDIGTGTISQDKLLAKRVPEMPAKLIPIIEEIWQGEVVGK